MAFHSYLGMKKPDGESWQSRGRIHQRIDGSLWICHSRQPTLITLMPVAHPDCKWTQEETLLMSSKFNTVVAGRDQVAVRCFGATTSSFERGSLRLISWAGHKRDWAHGFL